MSLYYEAASVLETVSRSYESLKSHIYNLKSVKSTPAHIFALTTQATKWSGVLKEVIENSSILSLERKLSPALALLLVHDLLFSKNGIAAPENHVLRLAVTRHKARLASELTRVRLKLGHGTIDALRAYIESTARQTSNADADADDDDHTASARGYPRWVRINTLRTSMDQQLATRFSDYAQVPNLTDVLNNQTSSAKVLHIDKHIPNLIALPPSTDVTKTKAYHRGELILQDKASCMPAYLLDPGPTNHNIIDACAAPGNKTTHLAAILKENGGVKQTVWACERDKARSETLTRMVKLAAGDQDLVRVRGDQDFLKLSPEDPSLGKIGALLLDPSCSGSGIVGRDIQHQGPKLVLPEAPKPLPVLSKGHKRRRGTEATKKPSPAAHTSHNPENPIFSTSTADVSPTNHDSETSLRKALKDRLKALSTFQLKLLLHAFRFPHARKITYSTCSIHAAENEHVVIRALGSAIARQRGWRIWRREEQVGGLREWHLRGVSAACRELLVAEAGVSEDGGGDGDGVVGDEASVIAQACIRCEKGTEDGTMGFFVAGFVRDGARLGYAGLNGSVVNGHDAGGATEQGQEEDEEWQGFSDDDANVSDLMGEVGLEDVNGAMGLKKVKKSNMKRKRTKEDRQ